jgi:1,4-dihydroxy-2-naphthoate octaprenyltransferase
VIFGKRYGRIAYLINGLFAVLIVLPFLLPEKAWLEMLFALFFALFIMTWLKFKKLEGGALNKILGHTSLLVFLFALIVAAALIFN